jgi:hypothetical protein
MIKKVFYKNMQNVYVKKLFIFFAIINIEKNLEMEFNFSNHTTKLN